jgi:predicted  nucleic acid-binding Zn-ribbon protein
VPDDDRKRRRLGDETKGRIADLASGWDTPGEPPSAPEPPGPPPNAARRKKQTTLPPPPPGSPARKKVEEDILDITDDVEADPDGWELSTTATSGRNARRPSSTRSGPTESGSVDVSGLIPEKTQPPELIVPAPTVDASALGVVDRGGAPGAPKSGPVPKSSSSGPIPQTPKSSSSGPVPKSSSSGPIPQTPRTPPSSSIADRLPLPPNAPEAPPRSISTPPRPSPAPLLRPGRPAVLFLDDSGTATVPEAGPLRAASPQYAVPVGEFDSAPTELDQEKRRIAYEQGTIKRDPSNALLGIADGPQTVVKEPPVEVLLAETAAHINRGDPTTIDPATHPFERGDPTSGSDPTGVRAPDAGGAPPQGRLRTIAQLRRRRGVGGDMRYVLTAIFGLRRARRELAELEAKEGALQQSRRRHLITLGRTAVTADGFDHPALGPAREQLAGIEEERSRHAGQVTAADAELQRVTRDRDAKAQQYAIDMVALEAELGDLAKKLEPLEKEAAGVTRRAADLRDAMRQVDEKIAFAEAALSTAEKEQRAALQAEIASLRADRKAVAKDEPALASALDSLQPRIAKLEGARAEARRRRVELEQSEREDQRRVEELLTAIGAKRKVVDRAASDAEAARDKILFELGERLYVDRPAGMSPELSPIDAIDVELGTVDRRSMELREILQSVDRMKIARGIALWILLLTAIGVIVALALGLRPPV